MAPGPPPRPDLSRVLELLQRQVSDGWHDCAQVYVSLRGEPLLDAAVGESRPGRALQTDDVMLWYSSGKPLTTVAVLQLWEQGRLDLDDRIADFVDGWGGGKERATVRHVLTHTGGFPMLSDSTYDLDVTYAESIERIAAHPAEWEPGTAAGYQRVERLEDPRRGRRGRRRPGDRPVPARRGAGPGAHGPVVPRSTGRRAALAR